MTICRLQLYWWIHSEPCQTQPTWRARFPVSKSLEVAVEDFILWQHILKYDVQLDISQKINVTKFWISCPFLEFTIEQLGNSQMPWKYHDFSVLSFGVLEPLKKHYLTPSMKCMPKERTKNVKFWFYAIVR